MKFSYYPGCSATTTSSDFEMSTRNVIDKLGIELVEIPEWTCCGSTPAHHKSKKLSIALPVLNLIKADEMGYDVLTTCPSCFSRLKRARIEMLKDKSLKKDIEDAVGDEYRGMVEVKHILEIFAIEEIRRNIQNLTINPLSGLKVASYYGCLLSRPSDVNIFRKPENPSVMDDVIEDIGGVALDWDYKTECCGANFTITKPEIVEKLTYRILSSAVESGVDAIVVACPFCQLNLDLRQRDVNRSYDEEFNIPVLYITQFIGLAMGLSEGELGMDKLMTDPTSVLERI